MSALALGVITVSFSFMGISQSLPTTSYMKWIDFWMMFSIIMPFLEVLAQAGNYMLRGEMIRICNSASRFQIQQVVWNQWTNMDMGI